MEPNTQTGSQSAWRAIGRPIAAYFAAAFVSAFVLCHLNSWFGKSFGNFSLQHLEAILLVWLIAGLIIAILAALPTLLVAGCLFATRIPRGIGEMCGGAIIGLISLFMFTGFDLSIKISEALTTIVPGVVAGLTYWLLVGRPKNPNRRCE